MESTGLEAFKANKIRPTLSGLSDSKDTGKACDVMLGLTNPYSFEIKTYAGYDCSKLKGNLRFLEVVLNRSGQSNGLLPMYFDGAVNYYDEMPRPDEEDKLSTIYSSIENRVKSMISKCYHFIVKRNKY